MTTIQKNEMKNFRKSLKSIFALLLLALFASVSFYQVFAVPASPTITYVSNTTASTISANRSDPKGTITTLTMTLNQQSYKWKAYVGNVTGGLTLDDANTRTIYDWTLATITGEVYVTRASSTVNWGSVYCVNQTVIDGEQSVLGMTSTGSDSINSTFNYTAHRSFVVGAQNITNSSCRSTATYVNDTRQVVNETAYFQEVLLKDNVTGALVYTTFLEQDQLSYNGQATFDFQILVAENESSASPTQYFFYVELG